MILNQFGKSIKEFRSDLGGEYTGDNMKQFFNEKGLVHQMACAGTPQQNGLA